MLWLGRGLLTRPLYTGCVLLLSFERSITAQVTPRTMGRTLLVPTFPFLSNDCFSLQATSGAVVVVTILRRKISHPLTGARSHEEIHKSQPKTVASRNRDGQLHERLKKCGKHIKLDGWSRKPSPFYSLSYTASAGRTITATLAGRSGTQNVQHKTRTKNSRVSRTYFSLVRESRLSIVRGTCLPVEETDLTRGHCHRNEWPKTDVSDCFSKNSRVSRTYFSS